MDEVIKNELIKRLSIEYPFPRHTIRLVVDSEIVLNKKCRLLVPTNSLLGDDQLSIYIELLLKLKIATGKWF